MAQSPVREQSAARVAGQVSVGTLVTPVGFFGSGWATKHLLRKLGAEDETASRSAYVAAYSGAVLGGAAGPVVMGRGGKNLAALAGSTGGLAIAALGFRLGNAIWDDDRRRCGIACWSLGSLVVALPSIGATVAYAASRK